MQNVNLTSKTKIKKLPDFDLRKYHIIRDNQLSLAYTSDSEEYPDLKYNANKDRNYFLGTFENCPLSSVTIPDQVVSLSSETFANGDDEFHVSPIGKIHFGKYFKGAINTRNIFEYSPNSCTLYSVQPNKITVAKENKKYCVKDNILYTIFFVFFCHCDLVWLNGIQSAGIWRVFKYITGINGSFEVFSKVDFSNGGHMELIISVGKCLGR